MSDAYSFDDIEQDFEPVDFVKRQQRATVSHVLSSLDDNPDDAVKARDIGEGLGLPAPVVMGNLENYEKQHKAAITASLLNNNKFLAEYAASNPMAAKISSDDWGQLDAASEKLPKGSFSIAYPAIKGFVKGFTSPEGFGEEPIGTWAFRAPGNAEVWTSSKMAWNILGLPFEVGGRLFTGAVQGLNEGLVEGMKAAGWSEGEAKRFSRDFTGMVEQELMGLGPHTPKVSPSSVDLIQARRLMQYVVRGEEPPVGISPIYDTLKAEEARIDLQKLKEATKEVNATNTKIRSPEDMEGFIRQHVGGANIEIDASAVRQLYGSKVPGVDDGLLGWVPGLENQLRVAETSGGDITVPLATWLARVEPEVQQQLHDFIRVRPNGMNLEEGPFFKEHAKAMEDNVPLSSGEPAVDSVRSASALDPMFDEARQQKLTLERRGAEVEDTIRLGHEFDIKDANGDRIGNISIHEENSGKKLYVDWWGAGPSIGPEGLKKVVPTPGFLGPRVVRDLITQLKQEFPNAEELAGFRVSGARAQASTTGPTRISLKSPSALSHEELNGLAQQLREIFAPQEAPLQRKIIHGDNELLYKPTEAYTPHEQAVIAEISRVLDRVAPTGVEKHVGVKVTDLAREKPTEVWGMYDRPHDPAIDSAIMVSLNSDDPVGTARHEAIHHLRQRGFFKPEEWQVLEDAAKRNKWAERWGIAERWKNAPNADILEETIAEAYNKWGRNAKMVDEAVHPIFQKLKDLFDEIKAIILRLTGTERPGDIFQRVESGQVGRREAQPERYEGKKSASAKEPELPQTGTTRIEDRPVFLRGDAIGMTQDQLKRYMDLIDKRDQEDALAALKKLQESERVRQTAEWKDNTTAMRKEVERDIFHRPDIAADRFFQKGIFYNERVKGRIPQIDPEHLTPQQRKGLPPKYIAKKGQGIMPDDIAGSFGYQSGYALVERLVQLEQARKESGLEGKPFYDKLIDDATKQRMEQTYGDLKENIFQDAYDQAYSQTQLDIIHEEVLALAAKNKAEISLTKDQMTEWLQKEFNNLPTGFVSSKAFGRSAGRAGKLAELSLLKNDPAEAFKAKQAQFNALFLAKEAAKVEKLMAKFDATVKRMSSREVPSVEQEYTNWIHDLLYRGGREPRRTLADLQNEIANQPQKTFPDFVLHKQRFEMQEVDIDPSILDPKFNMPVEKMTVDQFKTYKDAIDNLVHVGKEAKKVYKAGEEAALDVIKGELINGLKTFPFKAVGPDDHKIGVRRALKTYTVSHLQLEALFNRWDRGNPGGVWTQYVMRNLAEAANEEAALERKFSKMIKDIKDDVDLNQKVDNNIFLDPFSKEAGVGYPIEMTRKHLRAILLNVGNPSNLDKLARGYGVDADLVVKWLHNTALKEDWDWAQKVGDIFAKIKVEADEMYRRLAGIAPENVEIHPIQTPHGEYKGWYYPVIYHPTWLGKSRQLAGGDPLEMNWYFRATPSRGYTKTRTGYAAPLSLDLDDMVSRMKQMLHDIAFREAIINANKILGDPAVLNTISAHYGPEYSKLMAPYLRDVANAGNYNSDAAKVATSVLEGARQNLIATLIGFNPGTVMKHGPTAWMNSLTEVGAKNFLAEAGLIAINPKAFADNWQIAMEKSTELQRRTRHWNETLGGAHEKSLGEEGLRETLIRYGAAPVALSDLLSAVPTWTAKYKAMIRDGASEGDAVYEADRAVRRAHGSTAITNRPAIARGGVANAWMASLYGFFSHILNRQYELGWRAHDAFDKFKAGEFKEGAKDVPRLAAMTWSYVVFPALIEEMVSGHGDPREGWGRYFARALGHGLSSSWIGIRDFAHAMAYGSDPSVGLFSTAINTGMNTVRDIRKMPDMFNKQNAGKTLQHSITMFGLATGLTNAQEGKAARFMYDYATGQQKPKYLKDWWHGLRTGSMEERRR